MMKSHRTTSRRQGGSREADAERSRSAVSRAEEHERHRRPSTGTSQHHMTKSRFPLCMVNGAVVRREGLILTWGDLAGRRLRVTGAAQAWETALVEPGEKSAERLARLPTPAIPLRLLGRRSRGKRAGEREAQQNCGRDSLRSRTEEEVGNSGGWRVGEQERRSRRPILRSRDATTAAFAGPTGPSRQRTRAGSKPYGGVCNGAVAHESRSKVFTADDLYEPPDADPHVRWCGSRGLTTPGDPIRRCGHGNKNSP